MTRKYSLVIEGVSASYSAYVPELPTILVTGRSVEELTNAPPRRFAFTGRACTLRRLATSAIK